MDLLRYGIELIGDGFWMAGTFLWMALWALILGFFISGAIQAFVSREGMVKYMGEPDLRSILYSMGFGMASTSCSFGDIAATKTLFKKGAHIVPSVTFLISSTNFVIGLSFVIWALLGWEFALGQAIGAPIMIVIAIVLVHLTVSYEHSDHVREKLVQEEQPVVTDPVCHMSMNRENAIEIKYKEEPVFFCSAHCREMFEEQPESYRTPWSEKITSWNGWVEAANQTRRDLMMLWKELLLGFVVAGFVAVLVPDPAWTVLFEGVGLEGWADVLYNTLVGPLISVATFVGSMGNVPLAAVLWGAGFAFAGVIAFLYADLIVPQLIQIYIKILGWRLGGKLTGILYVSMVATGFIVYYLFSGLGWIPERVIDAQEASMMIYGLSLTSWLNLLFLGVALGLIVLLVRGKSQDPSAQMVEDPVSGGFIQVAKAPYCLMYEETMYYFENKENLESFRTSPESHLPGGSKIDSNHGK